jgi:hypothetical protein
MTLRTQHVLFNLMGSAMMNGKDVLGAIALIAINAFNLITIATLVQKMVAIGAQEMPLA